MPSGPTGRGCEACRKMRKKCDMKQPACSRCQRSQIPCIGGGTRRFKFVSHQTQAESGNPELSGAISAGIPKLTHVPSNESTRLAQALVFKVRPSNDLRHWIVWQYGPFVSEIPRRIGRSLFLDHAVRATLMIHTESCLQAGQDDPQAPAAKAYFRALKSLRKTLDDPVQAASTETLCGVMLLVYGHLRFDGDFATFWSPHGNGLLHLLRLRQSCRSLLHFGRHVAEFEKAYQLERYYAGSRDNFEDVRMFMALPTVLLQSFANPEVVITPEEYRSFENSVPGETLTAKGLRYKIDLSELTAEARTAIENCDNLEPLIVKSEVLQTRIQDLLVEHRQCLAEIRAQKQGSETTARLEAIYLRRYGLTMTADVLTACLRRALRPDDELVKADTATSVCIVMESWASAKEYLPLGASWLGWALMSAWCATRGMTERAGCEAFLLKYMNAVRGSAAVLPFDLLLKLERRLWLGRIQ